MKFRLVDVLWLFALFAAGMTTFGPAVGTLAAGVVGLAQWAALTGRLKLTRLELVVVVAIVGALVALLLPAVVSGGSTAARTVRNMRRWSLALQAYHDQHGSFPPGSTVDATGRPLHSWRALVLEYVGEPGLAQAIDLRKRWDSPSNARALRGTRIDSLKNPRLHGLPDSPDTTHYLAVVDEGAVLQPGESAALDDIADGPANTIVLIEVGKSEVPWYEPRDLTIDHAAALLCGETSEGELIEETRLRGFFRSKTEYRHRMANRCVAFADGHCEFIGRFPDRDSAKAYLTRDGGEALMPLEETLSRNGVTYSYEYHWGRVWCLVVFVAISLAPAARFLRSRGKAA